MRNDVAVRQLLAHLGLRPEHARVALPLLAVREILSGRDGDAIVNPVAIRRAHGELVLLGRDGLRIAEDDEPARVEETAESHPEPGIVVLELVEARVGKAVGRDPGKRRALELAVADVEAAVDYRREAEAGAGPDVEHPDIAAVPLTQGDRLDAGDLTEMTDTTH
jgi:hypothetical protein